MIASTLPPIVQVQATLDRAAPPVGALPHVADLISDFLDASKTVTLVRAAASGSTRLFERVAAYRLDATHADPIVRSELFAQALQAAIEINNLAMAKAIHRLHPEPLNITSLELAMTHGSLELVQWVIANRQDPVCCDLWLATICADCVKRVTNWIHQKDTSRIVSWLIEEGVFSVSDCSDSKTASLSLQTALRESVELVRWCDAEGLLSGPMIARLMRATTHATDPASMEIVRYFLERGYDPAIEDEFVDALIVESRRPGQEALVQRVLDSEAFSALRHHFVYAPTHPGGEKVLQWDLEYRNKRGLPGSQRLSLSRKLRTVWRRTQRSRESAAYSVGNTRSETKPVHGFTFFA